MAFKRYDGEATTIGAAIYTVPASTNTVVIGFNLANKTSTMKYVTADLAGTKIVTDTPIPGNGSLSILDGKIVAVAGEVITVTADADTAVDVMISVLEQGV